MASIYHFRKDLHRPHEHADLWAMLRAILGGLIAIVLLVALVVAITGGALYAIVTLLTMLFQ